MARLQIEGLCKGWDFPVIDRLDLTVEEGEFFVIVGPSGIGKTTLLRLVAGLETPDAGRVTVGSRDVTRVPPYQRNVAMTFESYALYPHVTVGQNIASPLVARKMEKADIKQKVTQVAELLRIGELLDRKPGEISGGQKQRTALGRTLVADPDVFLLDEPISHLDAKIRHELREQFHTLEALRRVATLYVTHDYAEALSLGDRIGVLGRGGLVQTGTPRELFERPDDLFVARNLGQPTMNVVETNIIAQDGRVSLNSIIGASLQIALTDDQIKRLNGQNSGAVSFGVRPQNVRILGHEEAANDGQQIVNGQVAVYEALGSNSIIIVNVGGVELTALGPPGDVFERDQLVRLAIETDAIHLFDTSTGRAM